MNQPFVPRAGDPSDALAMAEPPKAMPAINIDFRRILAALYRNRFYIAGILFVAVAFGVISSLSTTPIYRATASVQIDSQAAQVVSNEEQPVVDYDTTLFLQTNLDVLMSRAMALSVVDALKLASSNDAFNRMQVDPPAGGAPGTTIAQTRREYLADVLRGNVNAALPKNSRVVQINFESPDPTFAARVATAYANALIASNVQRKFDSSAYARKYLEGQLGLAKDRLESSERAQVDYARSAGLFDVQSGTAENPASQSILLSDLVAVNDSLNAARAARVAAEQRYRVAASVPVMSLPEVQTSPSIQQLLQRRSDLAAQYAADSQRYRPDYPLQVQRQSQIRTLDQQIAAQAGQVRSALQTQYQSALRNEQQLARQVAGLRSGNQAEQQKRIRYNILAREANTNRAMYDGLLQRYKEVSASAGVANSNISMVDEARIPGAPVRPRPLMNLLMALIGGIIVAFGFVFLRDYYDDATRTPDDIINKLNVPFLGIIPKLPPETPAAEVLDDPKSSVSEAFAALRTQMGLITTDGQLGSISVTSSRESEGKSLIVYGIAHSFARLGKRVLVIDADLRRPSQHRLFERERTVGLSNVLSRQSNWKDVVQKTDRDNVDFMATGQLPPSVPELLSGGGFGEMLEEAGREYDLVMIDSPPVLGLADAILLGGLAKHLVYVIEAGRPLRGRGLAAVRRLRAAGLKIDGAVLNKFDPKYAGYGYEYGYYYYYGRGD
ncbi:GumC family protein [Parablastomonas sp. CN1-191]|uniref:GumC family protein n=1 Tax=Parablastomonas sp. CN1-191 TaxID=3400908 RepID=UPI003BF7B3EE